MIFHSSKASGIELQVAGVAGKAICDLIDCPQSPSARQIEANPEERDWAGSKREVLTHASADCVRPLLV